MKTPCAGCGCSTGDSTPAVADPAGPGEIGTEGDVVRIIEIGRGDSAFTKTFLELLDERHAVYRGLGTPAVRRIRGALLLALGHRALPTTALPFVLEELESAHDAWLTAVAAYVLRKYPEPSESFAEPLISALLYIRHRDETVRLVHGGERGVGNETTTATKEVMRTIGWLGRAGAACLPRLEDLLGQNPGPTTSVMVASTIDAIRAGTEPIVSEACGCASTIRTLPADPVQNISGLRLQDHTGAELTFGEAFRGRPSIVVFFYTRCDNPAKCPLTMYKFGRLQRLLDQSELGRVIGMAAITYDPEYDRAERLLQYAQSWGVAPSAGHRILRAVHDFPALSDYFSLGVNFSASGIVNRHQLEAFILDPHGRIAYAVTRRRWDEAELMRCARGLL